MPSIRKTYNIHDIYVFQSWMNQSTRSQQHLKYSGGWTFTSISLTCSFMRTGPMKSLTSPRDFLLVTSGQPQSLLVYSHRWLRTHTSRHRFPPASSERSFSSQISQQFVPKSITNAVGTWRCVREGIQAFRIVKPDLGRQDIFSWGVPSASKMDGCLIRNMGILSLGYYLHKWQSFHQNR